MPPCFVCYYDRVNKNIKQSQFIHYEKNYRERGSKVPAQPVKFNTPGAAKRKKVERMERWKDDRLFFYDYSQMLAGLASGRGRRPARQKMSKRDLRIIKMIAAEGVRLMKFQEAFDPAGAKQSRDKLCAIAGRPDLAASIRPPDVYQPPDIFQPAKTITIRL